jgi:hypothetical protein
MRLNWLRLELKGLPVLELDRIRIDGDTQSRVNIDEAVVAEYAEAMKAGVQFPPVIVFFDGVDRWLADGFHRYHGARLAGLTKIYEEITPGTRRDAVLYHGLKRTNADKRKAVETLLKDAEWATWSDRRIAEVCGVSHELARQVRGAICQPLTDAQHRTVERNGKTYQQNTAKIGRTPAAPPTSSGGPASSPPPSDKPGSAVNMGDSRGIDPDPAQAPESAPPPPAAQAEPTPPEYTELDAARDQIADLQAALALANMGDVPEADRSQAAELIEQLQSDVKGLTAQLRAVTSSRDFLMQENAQMKQQLAAQRREIDRLKAVAA